MGVSCGLWRRRISGVHKSHHDDLRGPPQPPGCFFVKASWRRSHHSRPWPGADKQQQQQHNQPWIRNSWDRGVSLRPSPQTTLTLRALPPSTTTGWRWRWTSPTSPPCPFQELEEVEEVKEEETTTNSSLLSNLINQCGIPLEEQQEKITTPCSPSNSMNSDLETHQSLIE